MDTYLSTPYLAGVFDSDGSFTVAKRHLKRSKPNYTAMIQLTWKKSKATETFMQMLVCDYGGSYASCISTNTMKSFSGTKDYFKYCVTGMKAEKLAAVLSPWLLLKKEQAMNIRTVAFLSNESSRGRSDLVSSQLEALYVLNKSLNTKNGWKNV